MPTEHRYEVETFQAGQDFDLDGEVVDDEGNPVSNVTLVVKSEEDDSKNYSVQTDSDGKFLLEKVKKGKYTVTLQSDETDETESADNDKSPEETQASDQGGEDSTESADGQEPGSDS